MNRFGSGLPVDIAAKAEGVMLDVLVELGRAVAKHRPMHSAHEGYAVLLEELEELWDEVRRRDLRLDLMRSEAIQVAAMAVRFVLDVCDGRVVNGE